MADWLNGVTYCPFGQFCNGAVTCDKLVTQQHIKDGAERNIPVCQYVKPPADCFKPNQNAHAFVRAHMEKVRGTRRGV